MFIFTKSDSKLPSLVRQLDQNDCGIACLLSIIDYYGGVNDFENLRRQSGTTKTGTTMLGLLQAAQASGFDAEGCEADIEALLAHPTPCILHVLIENKLQHYVVYYGNELKYGKKNLIIGDPAKGVLYYTPEELNIIWKSKACLLLSPNSMFQKKQNIDSNKKKWLKELIKEDIPLLMIAAAMGIVIASLGLTMAVFSQRLIDEFLPQKQYTKLYAGIGFVFLLLLAREWVILIRNQLLTRQSKEFNLRIVKDFFHAYFIFQNHFLILEKLESLQAAFMIQHGFNGWLAKLPEMRFWIL